jgi:GH18 family chitinase
MGTTRPASSTGTTAKVDLVRREALGGVTFWELSGDDAESTLLHALHDQLPH